ncbi:zinc finger AN1 domain-containing stress-associated protein 12 [Elaeis guineensis]|uniref:Zinc finger AN1 domain-containing stress-associated protein 12 n=1 Tax=Elaeis guineensis var. tenera TaxID=51953 RepID=A0A6I9QQK7_ELAGV|nr:zinc finger AN1 domain-containing stress-associated protein 12 [Elaeis guineensis]
MGRGGTEAFPDLGAHCDHEDCKQLDFLPFTCDGCQRVFCLEHRTYKAHSCPKAEHNSRIVVVCQVCSMSIEKKAGEEDSTILERHERSGDCDARKKHKPRCPVRRCKELLTFSNNSTCKTCNQKVCLKHRFPSDHACKPAYMKDAKVPVRLPARNGTDCGDRKSSSVPSHQNLLTSH